MRENKKFKKWFGTSNSLYTGCAVSNIQRGVQWKPLFGTLGPPKSWLLYLCLAAQNSPSSEVVSPCAEPPARRHRSPPKAPFFIEESRESSTATGLPFFLSSLFISIPAFLVESMAGVSRKPDRDRSLVNPTPQTLLFCFFWTIALFLYSGFRAHGLLLVRISLATSFLSNSSQPPQPNKRKKNDEILLVG